MVGKNKIESILLDIYRDLYTYSTPSTNFDVLYNEAKCNLNGEKIIPYEKYHINDEVLDEIIHLHTSINNLSRQEKQFIKLQVYFGYSPEITTK